MDTCIICGHEITNDISIARGMGRECEEALKRATMKRLFSIEGNSLQYNWIIKVGVIRSIFIETFKDTKFRKEFKRSFYTSICENKRVSKNQLKIMEDWLFYIGTDMSGIQDEISREKKRWYKENSQNISVSAAEIEIARREIRGLN